MQTECPHCNTVFRVEESVLEQADGQVRCGHCLAVFTANNPYNATSYPDENITDTALDKDNAENSKEEKDFVVADVIPPELRAETEENRQGFVFITSLVVTLVILAGIAGLLLQYVYYNRDSLVKITELRPLLNIICEQANCTLPPPKDLKSITLSSKNIFSHPNVENALMVSASIINQAEFAQAFPIIELRFENIRGETIAGRRFTATEYLGIPEEQISQMQPDISVNISLEIKDPGSDTVSYEFAFL